MWHLTIADQLLLIGEFEELFTVTQRGAAWMIVILLFSLGALIITSGE